MRLQTNNTFASLLTHLPPPTQQCPYADTKHYVDEGAVGDVSRWQRAHLTDASVSDFQDQL